MKVWTVVSLLLCGLIRVASAQGGLPQRAWIEGGLGVATSPAGDIGALLSGWYTVGPVAVGARSAGAVAIFGEQRNDRSFLVGARTPGNDAFLLGAIGLGSVSSERTCDGPGGDIKRPTATELTYQLEAHAGFPVVGLGLVFYGSMGPPAGRYNAFALTLNVGWFGESRP